MNMSTDSKVVF